MSNGNHDEMENHIRWEPCFLVCSRFLMRQVLSHDPTLAHLQNVQHKRKITLAKRELVHYFASCIILSRVASWNLNDFCDELQSQSYELSYDFHGLIMS